MMNTQNRTERMKKEKRLANLRKKVKNNKKKFQKIHKNLDPN